MGRYIRKLSIMAPPYPHSSALLQLRLKLEHCQSQKAAYHPKNFDIIKKVKLFATVYSRIYWHKFLTLTIRHRVTKGSALEYAMTS